MKSLIRFRSRRAFLFSCISAASEIRIQMSHPSHSFESALTPTEIAFLKLNYGNDLQKGLEAKPSDLTRQIAEFLGKKIPTGASAAPEEYIKFNRNVSLAKYVAESSIPVQDLGGLYSRLFLGSLKPETRFSFIELLRLNNAYDDEAKHRDFLKPLKLEQKKVQLTALQESLQGMYNFALGSVAGAIGAFAVVFC